MKKVVPINKEKRCFYWRLQTIALGKQRTANAWTHSYFLRTQRDTVYWNKAAKAYKLPLLFCDQIHMDHGPPPPASNIPKHLTRQPASNPSQTHFTSGHIDGYWARVPFSSPEILNYTPAMCCLCAPPRRRGPTSELPLSGLAPTQTLKHDTSPAKMQILYEK